MKMVKDCMDGCADVGLFDITTRSVFLWLSAFDSEGNIAWMSRAVDSPLQHPET
jgi:hypothetical protein